MEPTRHTTRPEPTSGLAGTPAYLDRRAIASLFDEHGGAIRWCLLGMLRDPSAADDALQATFASLVEHGHTARPEAIRGWLYRVAYREAITQRRRSARRDRAERGLAWIRRAAASEPDGQSDPIVRSEVVEAVRRALEALPPEQRDVVRDRIYEDKTFARIAADRRLPLGTVLTRMRRALEKLARCLPDEARP